MENHFLDEKAERVNDFVWLEQTFELAKSESVSRNEEATYKDVLSDLRSRISKLFDIRMSFGNFLILWLKI